MPPSKALKYLVFWFLFRKLGKKGRSFPRIGMKIGDKGTLWYSFSLKIKGCHCERSETIFVGNAE
jgi:hypothetical protein